MEELSLPLPFPPLPSSERRMDSLDFPEEPRPSITPRSTSIRARLESTLSLPLRELPTPPSWTNPCFLPLSSSRTSSLRLTSLPDTRRSLPQSSDLSVMFSETLNSKGFPNHSSLNLSSLSSPSSMPWSWRDLTPSRTPATATSS